MSLVYIHLEKNQPTLLKLFANYYYHLLVFFLDHSVGQTLKWNSFELGTIQVDTV